MTEIPSTNHIIDCHLPHAEVLESETRAVWQSVDPISREEFATLDLPEGFVPIGLGRAVMDSHYFRQSPGASTSGPVSVRIIDGRRFIHCANPPENGSEQPIANGPVRLMVDKHHTIVFEAGRELSIIRTEDGADYVQVISASPEGGGLLQEDTVQAYNFTLPSGWQLRSEQVSERTVIHLPNPTEAWFFPDGSSFQGPISRTGS